MYYQLFTLTMLLGSLATIAQPKTLRVNNTPGLVTDNITVFGTIASAVTASANGDTIHIEPTVTSYGSFSLNKSLVIIGAGYFFDAPDNDGLYYQSSNSRVTTITLNPGSQGSHILGLTFPTSGLSVNLNNVTGPLDLLIEKCNGGYINNGLNNAKSGVTVRKYISEHYLIYFTNGTIDNFTMENCIVTSGTPTFTALGNGDGDNIVRNNVFATSAFTAIKSYFANNIVVNTFAITFTDCVVKHNLFASASQSLPPSEVGNQLDVNMTDVFVGDTGTNSLDAQYILKIDSPAIGAGVTIGGITPDCGAYGGPDPYITAGIPPIPSIYSLDVPQVIPIGEPTMNVIFSTRNNN